MSANVKRRDAPPSGLRDRVRALVLKDVLRASAQKCKGWMVLVLDAAAAKVLTPVLGMYDLMEERVTLVESLEKRRQPFPEMDAIYVVAAADRSFRAVCADWHGRAAAMYADAHVFSLDALADSQLNAIRQTPELQRRLKTLTELKLDFLALEAQAYDLGEPTAFRVAPNAAKDSQLSPADREAARKLATVLATAGVGGARVRYRAGNARARAFGNLVLERADARGEAAQVLILDRADDALTPLVHEYSYQALVQDVLEVEGDARDRVTFLTTTKSGKGTDYAILTDKDALWVEFRHGHVARVVGELRKRTKDFLDGNRGAAKLHRGRGTELSLGDMAQALQAMPEFQAATAALNKHMSLAHAALSRFQALGLLDQSQLEQTLATGRDADGDKKRPRDLAEDVKATLKDAAARGRGGADAHALRLLAVYVVAQGGRLSEAERADLFGAAQPDAAQQRALLCLAQLVAKAGGVPTADDARRVDDAAAKRSKAGAKKKKTSNLSALRGAMKSAFSTKSGLDADEEQDVENRFAPPLKALAAALCDDALDPDLYPALGGRGTPSQQPRKQAAVSARKTASRLAGGKAKAAFAGPKVVICVLGGATYSELRAAYEVSREKGREVLLGGSHLLTPEAFLTALSS